MAVKTANLKLELKFRDDRKRVLHMNTVKSIRVSMIFVALFLILFSIKLALADENFQKRSKHTLAAKRRLHL